MIRIRLHQAFVLLASWALATSAYASYAQMRLDGIELFLAFALVVAYGLIVDLALFARLFRYRAALVAGFVAALVVTILILIQAAPPGERAGIFKVHPGGQEQIVLVVTSAVFLPFILIAPFVQYRAMRHSRRWSGWITVGMFLQLALLPGFIVLANTEEHYWKREYATGQAVGREVRAGRLGELLELAEQRHERIWGTGWIYPWPEKLSSGFVYKNSAWIRGLENGVGDSALISANEPPSEPDRAALRKLTDRHFYAPNIRAKLIWDALEPGRFSKQLAPHGLNEQGVVSEEVIPFLLERLEKYGQARLCPGGRMMEADRAVLNELVLANVRKYDEARKREQMAEIEEKKRDLEMSDAPMPYRLMWRAAGALGDVFGGQSVGVPDWSGYPQRIEQLCRAAEEQASAPTEI
ncbi:MAG: hypothetical protein ACKVQK_05785 [Burkholderiales bacterium]